MKFMTQSPDHDDEHGGVAADRTIWDSISGGARPVAHFGMRPESGQGPAAVMPLARTGLGRLIRSA